VEADEGEVGLDHAGVDGGDANGGAEEILSETVVDGALGGFGAAVDGAVGVGDVAGGGAQVDDVSGVTLDHAGHNCAGDVEQPLDVGVDHLFPVVGIASIELFESAGETGVVDEDLDGLPGGGQVVDGGLDGFAIPDIEGEAVDGFGSGFGGLYGDVGKLFRTAGGEEQACALGCKGKSRGRSDSRAGTGDEDNLSLEFHGSILLTARGRPLESAAEMRQGEKNEGHLERRIGLPSAVLFNMLEMIGVGPFITLPLVLAAAGIKLAVWAWVLGAVVAVADGLVWAELGAMFPQAGGSYAFLRALYGPKGAGNWLGFLYVWQLSFSAPMAIASGCIGLASFLAWFWPHLEAAPVSLLPFVHGTNLAAAVACVLVMALLYRNLSAVTRLAWILFAGVLAAIAGVILSGFAHHAAAGGVVSAPAGSVALALGGLAQATLIATYDYWGYYNICFLGSEVKQPERTIPRAILISVALVAGFYVAMNQAAAAAIGALTSASASATRLQLVADLAQSAWGLMAGRLLAALVMWTAFASVFSLLLGYSRVPYAAAKDGNYFRYLDAIHPRHEIPHRSLVALGCVACGFCFFSLSQVITMLVVTRILLQFLLQHVGVIALRIREPERARPFRMPLFPLPPLVAMTGFLFMLTDQRRNSAKGGGVALGLAMAGAVAVTGSALYFVRAKMRGEWPFAEKAAE